MRLRVRELTRLSPHQLVSSTRILPRENGSPMITAWHNIVLMAVLEAKPEPADYIYIDRADLAQFGLPVTVALGAVALIGYIFGQRTRTKMMAALDERRQQELDRAARIAWQLEHIADNL